MKTLALAFLVPFAALNFAFSAPQDKKAEAQAAAPAQSAKEKKVRKLLDVTGASKMGEQVLRQMLAMLGQNPSVPAGFAAKFQELAKPSELIEKVVPIYKKHLDEDTITAALTFFQTKSGKAWVAAQQAIMRDSMQAGQAWGRALAAKAMKELRK